MAVPDYLVNKQLKKAIWMVPLLAINMFFNLFRMKGVNKKFIHTEHGFDGSVFTNVVMITGTAKTSCPVGSVHVPLRKGFILTGSETVNHNQINFSHLSVCPLFIAVPYNLAPRTEFSAIR